MVFLWAPTTNDAAGQSRGPTGHCADYGKAGSKLTTSEIEFIPNSDFSTFSEEDFAEVDIQLYTAEEECVPADRKEAASSFVQAIEHSRTLTFDGEQFLFKRLNFLRFRANALRMTLNGSRREKKVEREIDRLLIEAEETRNEIACANLRLVSSICRRLAASGEDFDELFGEANPILLKAIDKFDYSRGYRFSTYATHAVQRHIYRVLGRVGKRRKREISSQESLQAAPSEVVGDDEPSAQQVLDAAESIIGRLGEVLDEREQIIIRARYGLNEEEKPRTLRELSAQLGLSKERIRQLQQQAIEKLAEIARPFESGFLQVPKQRASWGDSV